MKSRATSERLARIEARYAARPTDANAARLTWARWLVAVSG